jgi:hypothetical protein
MTSAVSNDQIISLYEQGMTLEDIHEACDGEIKMAALKLILMQGSKKYRLKLKKEEEDFTQDDKELAMQCFRTIVMNGDCDAVKFRAANKIYDVVTGRDIPATMKGGNFNLTFISQNMLEAEEAIKIAKEKVIDVNPAHKHLMEMTN